MTSYPRFHPVVISRYIGIHDRGWTCWAIADRDHANRVADDRKFDDYETAKRAADTMNTEGK